MNGDVNRVVYVIIGWSRRLTNDRIVKVLALRPAFHRLVLVVRGSDADDADDGETLAIRAIPNPLSLLRRMRMTRLSGALERLLFFPNPHVLYTRVARRRLAERVERDLARGHEVTVMTCVPNHENTSIGLYLKRRFPGIHWVVDWQDLWSYDENYYRRVLPLYRPLLKARERAVLERADLNVTTNPYAERVLRDVYGVAESRLTWIPHHFDPDELPEGWERSRASEARLSRTKFGPDREPSQEDPPPPLRPDRSPDRPRPITIGFLGALFKPPRVPGLEFLEALRQIRASGVDVELHLHGPLPAGMRQENPALQDAGLVVKPAIARDEFVPVLRQYDYLLILLADLPNSRAVMSIKLPHYLVSGSPVLAVVPDTSAVADIVRRSRTGIVVPSDGDWRSELANVLKRHAQAGPARHDADEHAIADFSWARTSVRWMGALAPG